MIATSMASAVRVARTLPFLSFHVTASVGLIEPPGEMLRSEPVVKLSTQGRARSLRGT
jgi:hypothetical protein